MLGNTNVASEPVTRMAAEPYPVNPFRWHAILETPDFYQTAEINTLARDSIDSDPQRDVLYKPADTPPSKLPSARRSARSISTGERGPWCATSARSPSPGMDPPNLAPGRTWTTVEFTDLRFDYAFIGPQATTYIAALGGWVYIVDGHEDAGEAMNGREQH